MKSHFRKRVRVDFGIMAVLLATSSLASAATWSGASNTDWFNGANWTPGGVPGDGAAVVIGSGKTVVLANPTANLASLDLMGTLVFAKRKPRRSFSAVAVAAGRYLVCR